MSNTLDYRTGLRHECVVLRVREPTYRARGEAASGKRRSISNLTASRHHNTCTKPTKVAPHVKPHLTRLRGRGCLALLEWVGGTAQWLCSITALLHHPRHLQTAYWTCLHSSRTYIDVEEQNRMLKASAAIKRGEMPTVYKRPPSSHFRSSSRPRIDPCILPEGYGR
ncbi:hypothetical protein EV401DRAFT_1941029 [Pisolithus croceorrhizus]|nr:hypothetical protein EV401DRAFT_1941029 [Pisolithus croceorrhizus]